MKTEPASELITVLKQKLNQELISVVLFGSIVKGTFTSSSDIDVIVVCENPIKDWRVRDRMILDLAEDIELKYATPIHMTLVSKDEISHAIESIYPLMLEIYDANKEIFDALIIEAHSDLRSAKLLLNGAEFSRSIYHSQQAVEKTMEASLVLAGIVITDNHWVSDRFMQFLNEMYRISFGMESP